MRKILFCALLFVFTSVSKAAWWIDLNPPNDRQAISDDLLEFKLDDLQCGVSKTEFLRNSDDKLFEFRNIYCETANGTKFSVQANCRYPEYTVQQLQIIRGSTKYFPTLTCGPARPDQ